MSQPGFSISAVRWAKTIWQPARSPGRPPIWLLRWKLRRVRLKLRYRYQSPHEHARIYRALAARETGGSERELTLVRLAEAADHRVERAELSLRNFRLPFSFPAEPWLARVIRWVLLRWRISWTLTLLDRMESRRSHAVLEALMQLNRLCRVIAAARRRDNHLSTRRRRDDR